MFVTGHTGFKGAWLCKILEMAGAHVSGYALDPPTSPNLFEICRPDVRSTLGDIRDYEALLRAIKQAQPEIVIHMAAQPLVLDSYRRPRYTYDVNVMGTVNLLESARQYGGVKSLLNVTTDKVYLNTERTAGYREHEMLNGYDPYSNSKSCSELVTSCYQNAFFRETGVPVSTARSGNVIGGGDFAENRLIPDCARAASNGEKIILRNPNSVRPYQHVLDTLSAYLLIAEAQYQDGAVAGAYNIGPCEKDCVTSGQLASYFCEAWGGASWECVKNSAFHEAGMLYLDCTKVKGALGWTPTWDIKRAVGETAAWYQAYFMGQDANKFMMHQIEDFFK